MKKIFIAILLVLMGCGSSKNEDFDKFIEETKITSGQNKVFIVNGNTYVGEWYDECANGYGSCRYRDGGVYMGYWRDGRREGEGTMTFSNGDKYQGQWYFDRQDGYGTEYYSDGSIKRSGMWKKGEYVGE